jgi:hypothetical protein
LNKARRGLTIFDSPSYQKAVSTTSLPFFENPALADDLQNYLELSVASTTFDKRMPETTKTEIAGLVHQVRVKDKLSPKQTNGEVVAGNVEAALRKEHTRYKERFQFPAQQPRPRTLMSVDHMCLEHGIPSTSLQNNKLKREKLQIEHAYWRGGIQRILESFTDRDFDENWLKFIL